MRKKIKMAKFAYFVLVPLLIIAVGVNGRFLKHLGSSEIMISDGLDNVDDQRKPPFSSSFLILKTTVDSSEECEPLYGFLPCSTNVFGYLFLIVIYEYLLFHGESYVASGSERIFKILGPGVFGASAFHVLGVLPEALLVLATGLVNTAEEAQEHVYTVVGLLAGTSILNLTVIWGICVIVASQKKFDNSVSTKHGKNSNSRQRISSSLNVYGITTDIETSYTARIMVMSVTPYIIMQIPNILNISSEENIFILIALIISLVFLAFYFFYQIFQPWIQERRWEVVNSKHLISEILQNVQKQALEKILNDDGAPNVDAIKGLFVNIDGDGDNNLSRSEVKELVMEINKFKRLFSNEDKTLEDVMKDFDIDGDSKLNMDEFVVLITKWLDETKGCSDKSLDDLHEVLQPWIENKRKERETKNDLISEILRHLQSNARGSLLKKDGTPNVHNIRRLFEKIDRDKNNCITLPELKEVIVDLKFGNIPLEADEAVKKIMQELDTSEDGMISEEEFVIGVSRWLQRNPNNQRPLDPTTSQDGRYQETLEETQEVEEIENMEGTTNKNSMLGWLNAIMLLVIGIGILSFLAEPLINSVQNFSEAASIPSFFIGFILVPFATNARAAISAITEASRKKSRTTSLTFSEIYGGVIMNNIMSFSVLLAIIYIRGLTWEFSGEVLVVLIVCAGVGLITSFRSTYPIWASAMAFVLYPLSLLAVYVLDDVLNYS